MKPLFIILIGLGISWHFTDLSSSSTYRHIISPMGVFVFLISLLVQLVLKAGFGKVSDSSGAPLNANDFNGDSDH